ncbi:RND family transporter [Candidatus Bipolaricaulota bacterium]|nr:RND family transporter [Candidatus Bipolaricaulota bacterium]
MKRFFSWVVHHPWWVIGAMVALTVAFAVPISRLQINVDFRTYVDQNDPAYLLLNRAEGRYGSQSLIMVAVINPDGIFNAGTLAKIEALETRFAQIPGVGEVRGPLGQDIIISTDAALEVGPAATGGRAPSTPDELEAYRQRLMGIDSMIGLIVSEQEDAAAILLQLETDVDDTAIAEQVRVAVEELGTPPEQFFISGEPYRELTLTESMVDDLRLTIPIILVVMAAVLLGSFRTLRGVWIPLLVVGLAIIWLFGLMSLFGEPATVISFVLPVLLLAIGIAYGIHVLNRFNEEISTGQSKREALVAAMSGISVAVLMAGLTTVGGFLSLLTAYLPALASAGLWAAVGIVIAMVLSLILIPAILSVLPATQPRRNRTDGTTRLSRALQNVVRRLIAHPAWFLATVVILIAGLAVATPMLTIDSSMTAFLGDAHPSTIGMAKIDAHFAGSEYMVLEVDTNTADALKQPETLLAMMDLEAYLAEQGVRKTTSLTNLVRELNLRFHDDDPAYNVIPDTRAEVSQLLLLFSFQGGDLGAYALRDYSAGEVLGFLPHMNGADRASFVRNVRDYIATQLPDSISVSLVGPTQFYDSMGSQLISSQIVSLLTAVGVAAAIVACLMGSIVAGLIAAIPLALTILASFAVMAITGTSLNIATSMISSVTIGVGIDYAIHFLARYRREYRQTRDATHAAVATAGTAGQAILFNAIAVLAGFLVLLASKFMAFRSLGGLLALAMAVSAGSALTLIPVILQAVHPRFLVDPSWVRLRNRFNVHREQPRDRTR